MVHDLAALKLLPIGKAMVMIKKITRFLEIKIALNSSPERGGAPEGRRGHKLKETSSFVLLSAH